MPLARGCMSQRACVRVFEGRVPFPASLAQANGIDSYVDITTRVLALARHAIRRATKGIHTDSNLAPRAREPQFIGSASVLSLAMVADAQESLSGIERLNDDVLMIIIRFLYNQHRRDIKNLSLTCKRLRSICIPTVFEKANINCAALWDSDPPPAAWRYIKTMNFYGSFTTSMGFDAANLRYILPHLVALRKIRFESIDQGVGWYDLLFMAAAPNVHALEIEEPSSTQEDDFSLPEDASSFSLPFTEIVYVVHEPSRYQGRMIIEPDPIARRCYMTPFILFMHQTLEILCLPAAMAPLPEMATLDWPRLRELKFYSQSYKDEVHMIANYNKDFARLCTKMPRIRNLDLCIYLFHEEPVSQITLWPPGLPLPETLVLESMEKVLLPYPDPDDTFYKHLPSTLRELHLVDRPRYYRWDGGLTRFTKPTLITATELLRILKQLPARCIFMEQLEVAFRADGQELALYDYIAAAFPNLRVLQLHRYRISGEMESDIELTLESIARDVSSLRSLRHFRAYLNIPSDDYKSQDTHEQKARYTEEEFKALHHHYAMIIAQHCSPALQIVEFLSAWFHGSHYWLRWH
ncbi:hypothetical protein EVG20_g9405, partial [Dentipellis fragilis]